MADIDQVQFLICELLLQSMELNALPLVVAVVSVWPRAFSRSTSGPALFVNGSVSTKGQTKAHVHESSTKQYFS